MTLRDLIPVRWWSGAEDELEPRLADVEVERSDNPNEVAIHTFADGRGSLASYTLDRESARRLALRLLIAAEPDPDPKPPAT